MRIVVVMTLTLSLAVVAAFQFVVPTSAQVPIKPNPIGPVEELGRFLFWDPILSGNRDVACATCHHPDFAWADGRALSRGTGSIGLGPSRRDTTGGAMPVVRRNSPTILNVAFNGVVDSGVTTTV